MAFPPRIADGAISDISQKLQRGTALGNEMTLDEEAEALYEHLYHSKVGPTQQQPGGEIFARIGSRILEVAMVYALSNNRNVIDKDDIDENAGYPASQIEPPIDTLRPEIALLLPKKTFQPALPVTKISVQHDPSQTVKVFLNGAPVSVLNFDSIVLNTARTIAVSRWAGVNLEDGENDIQVVVSNEDSSAICGRSVSMGGSIWDVG